jgi:hypothetical protein
LFVTQDPAAVSSVSAETDALFRWLGVEQGFTLVLFWRDDPRRVATDEWPSRRTVNGGFTHQGSDVITVYRQEEWDRVLIHEAIHANNWDWDVGETPEPCWDLGGEATVSPHLFEAWTELYAEWLWSAWHKTSWDAQVRWMRYQAVQVLARNQGRPWQEDSNIFAYYVLKAALAPHIGFLWSFRVGHTDEERQHVLCGLATPGLAELRAAAARVRPEALSMRMARP